MGRGQALGYSLQQGGTIVEEPFSAPHRAERVRRTGDRRLREGDVERVLEKVARWAKGKEWVWLFEQKEHEKGGQGEDKEDNKMEDGGET